MQSEAEISLEVVSLPESVCVKLLFFSFHSFTKSLLVNEHQGLFLGGKIGGNVKLLTQHRLMQRLRMVFVAWCLVN